MTTLDCPTKQGWGALMEAPRSQVRGYGHEQLPSLRERALAPRPRATLESILATTSSTLELGLTSTLNELEQQLFKLAEQARSNDAQNRCFESLREVRRGRADVVPRFMLRLEAALATVNEEHVSPEFMRMSRSGKAELALIDPTELEQALALQEVAGKAEIRNSGALFMLGQRFGVLGGTPAFDADTLPVGPHKLCECLAEASRCLDIQFEHRQLLFRVFDRQCMPILNALYDQLNELCVRERILPNLQVTSMFKRVGGAQVPEVAAAKDAAARHSPKEALSETSAEFGLSDTTPGSALRGHALGPAHGQAPAVHAPQHASPGMHTRGAPAGAAHGHAPHAASSAGARSAADGAAARAAADGVHPHAPPAAEMPRAGIPAGPAGAFANPMVGWPGTPHGYQSERRAPPGPVERYDRPDKLELELFDTLRDLLSGRRHATGATEPPAGPNTHQTRQEDLQSVLASLQTKPAPPIMMGGKLVQRSVSHLRQDVLNQLRQLTPDGKQPRLAETDSDTMELVGMLFEHLSRDQKPSLAVQELLTRMQVPLLRVALRDRTFFTRRAHPARQLLNMVAEAGVFWLDEEAEDKALLEKMRLVVDRVSHEYADDLGIFDELAGDFSKHLGTMARKSELAERRHVDAARGREKLDVARSMAAQAMSEKLRERKAPALVKTLLEQAWTDVLALTLLRQGESSDVYRRRLQVAERLIEATTSAPGRTPPSASEANALQNEIEVGLSQVGYHVDDVRSVIGRFFAGAGTPAAVSPAAAEEAASATELAMKLKARARLGEDSAEPSPGRRELRPKIHPPLDAEEMRLLERLKTVPFGTWFEFEANQQGDKVRRKLSWFSPMTGRCLFVNQRGARADEKTLDQLAREITKGRASVVEASQESFIDKAWNAIVSTLKQFSSFGATPEPRPA